MPTYKEALKKLSKRKRRPAVARRKKSVGGKSSRRLKKSVRKAKPKRRVVKKRKSIKKKKIVRKSRPKKGRGPSTTRKKRVSGKKPVKKKVKKVKPKKRTIRKKVVKKRKSIKRRRLAKKKRVVRKKPIKKRRSAIKRKAIRKKKVFKKTRPKRKALRRARKKRPVRLRVYVGKGILDQLFESQAKVKLLKFFFRSPGELFQPKEIFKRLRSNVALLRQEMRKLEKLGLIKQKRVWLTFEKKRGGIRKEKKLVWYLDPNFDFFSELRNLVLKSAIASKNELVERAKKTGNIKLLVLTGVFTGDETARADLLIVGDKINQRRLSNFIKDLESEVGKEINCAVMTSKEFDYRYDMYDRFVRDLLEGKCDILLKRLELW